MGRLEKRIPGEKNPTASPREGLDVVNAVNASAGQGSGDLGARSFFSWLDARKEKRLKAQAMAAHEAKKKEAE